MRDSSDILVFLSRPTTLQRINDWVGHGYVNWVGGTVGLDRAPRLVRKFRVAYNIDSDRNVRARRKRAGLGNAVLVLWMRAADDLTLRWWLLLTPGDHPAHLAERMQDATDSSGRIVVDGFELVRVAPCETQRLQARYERPRSAQPAWTWRMDNQKYASWRESLIQAVRTRAPPRQLQDMFHALFASPGFSGVRHQVGKLAALYRAEWKRHRGHEEMMPLPARLGYVRRLPNEGAWLSVIVSLVRKEVVA